MSHNPTNYKLIPQKIPEQPRPKLHCGDGITLTLATSFLISHTAGIARDMFLEAFQQEQNRQLN
jgi:hypothetical protein